MTSNARKELMLEILNRKKLGGDQVFFPENSLQIDEDEDISNAERDPGVLNTQLSNISNGGDSGRNSPGRRRTVSQPGPGSGSMLTATAARAARKRQPRSVMYADQEGSDSPTPSPKFLTINDFGTGSPIMGERNSPLPPYNGGARNAADVRSINSYRIYTPNESRGIATPRKRSVGTMDAQSIRSMETQAPPPTTPEQNKQRTIEYFTLIASCMYAILLVTLGVIVSISDPFLKNGYAAIYTLVLTCMGLLYMIFLIADIARYKRKALKNQRIKSEHEEKLEEYFRKQEEALNNMSAGERSLDSFRNNNMLPPPTLIPLSHDYCFSQGRHSGSFYLKLGASGFALGHLIHSILLITSETAYYLDDDIDNEECVNLVQLSFDVINPIYCFFQLYFIFKYSNVVILRGQNLARFAFMHFIGSSLCFWLWAIVRETMLALNLYAQSYSRNDYADSKSIPVLPASLGLLDISSLYNENCIGPKAVSAIYESFSPYLYPFSVEFNILIVAVYYIIWDNISNCHNDSDDDDVDTNSSLDDNTTLCKIPTASEENNFTSNIVIYADCHASNRGLFLGMIVMVITAGMLIIGFVFSSVGDEFLEIGYMLNDCTKLSLHIAMLVAAVFAYHQTRKLDINEHPISLLDDILLFICLPAFFMETLFSMIATISILNIVKTIDFVVMVIQVIVQTPLIVDGLRRCSNSRKLRRSKPARELIMFLLITNVAMWLFNTFSYKSPDSLDERYAFYGKVLWTILGHISLPLIMFYRFHSSVCFADIWDSAYKPGTEH